MAYAFINGPYPKFSLEKGSGKIFIAQNLDYETTKTFTLKVTAADSASTVTATVTVSVTDANDNSPIFNPVAYRFVEKQFVIVKAR